MDMKATFVRALFVLIAVVASAALLPRAVSSRDGSPAPPRDITIVAKGMTFYIDGDERPNPTIRVKAGERIRLVLRNEDAGMTHDLVVKDWKVATKTLAARGEQDAVVFQVPGRQGDTDYQCTPHSAMMRGRIRVE